MNTNNAPKYLACLVRAESYVLRDRHCRPGDTWVFSEAEMVHCEEHAIQVRTVFDHYTGHAVGEPVGMFEFEPFEGPEPVGHRFPTEEEIAAADAAKAARARSRRIALAKATVDGTPARARTRSRAA